MRVVSLFTGAGGLDLGLKQAGHQIILQCESDPGAQQVLKHSFPGVLLMNDVCSLQSLPKETELLAAGFPCIDVSRAGLRKGFQGQSSGLVRHVFRLLQDTKDRCTPVPWVLLENVEALLDRGPNSGMPFVKSVVDSLEMLGYQSWAHRVVGSAGFGVPNRRCRVFILASLHGDARDVLLTQGQQACTGACCPEGFQDLGSIPCYECYQHIIKRKAAKDASFALDLGNARSAPGVDVVPTFTTSNDRMCLLLSTGRMGMLRIEDAERLQGFPVGFTAPCYPIQAPGLNSHKHRPVKDSEVDVWESKRFALLGNAVTVQVARWIGERLASLYVYKYIPSDRDIPIMADFRNEHEKANGSKVPTLYNGHLGEFESFEGGLLVRKRKANRRLPCLQDGNGAVDSVENSSAVEGSNQAIKKEFYGRKEMQGDAWPRAAWSVRGIGRFGVEDMSESPVKFPFISLGNFVSEVGKLPGNDVINTYIMRLREQGWHVDGVVRKATNCGVNLEKEVSSIVRLEGSPDDPEQIGDLVWVPCPVNKLLWPAEMLDPLNLPPCRSIPSRAINHLTKQQRTSWLPRDLWHPEDATGGDQSSKDAADKPTTEQARRKVLVVFFGDNTHNWVLPEVVVDFSQRLTEEEASARKLHAEGSLKSPTLFFRALEEAKIWLTIKHKKRTRGAQYVSAVTARAARLAADENRKPRCGNCEACLHRHSGGLQRRCLTVRAHAAAMGGHAGAQLAVYRERAIGAQIHVYWPLDQQWYTGVVTDYDRIQLRHTVTYDDGDREVIPLWSPCQLIRVLTTPKEWQAKAVEINMQQEKERERQKVLGFHRKEMARGTEAPLTQLEMDRDAMIKRNESILDAAIKSGCPQDSEASPERLLSAPSTENVTTPRSSQNRQNGSHEDSNQKDDDSGNKSEQTARIGLKRPREDDEFEDTDNGVEGPSKPAAEVANS